MVTTTSRENGEFCVAVAPAIRTGGILTSSWLKALAVTATVNLLNLNIKTVTENKYSCSAGSTDK